MDVNASERIPYGYHLLARASLNGNVRLLNIPLDSAPLGN